MITREQEKTLDRLRAAFLKNISMGYDDYEFKSFGTDHIGVYKIFLTMEVGLKNDENTMAGIVCRTRVTILIGLRGGFEIQSFSRGLKSIPKKDWMIAAFGTSRKNWVKK